MRIVIFILSMIILTAGCVVNKDLYKEASVNAMNAPTHEQAIKEYEANAKKTVQSHYFYDGRGDIHFHYGYFGRAVNDYTRALKTMWNAQYNLKRGRAYLKLHFYNDAKIDFTTVIESKGYKFPVAYVERAKAYAAEGDYSSAMKDMEKAREKGGENAEFLEAMGELNFKMGRYDEAKLYVQKAIIANSENPALYLLRAKIFYKQKNANQAIADLKTALKMERDYVEAKRMLAWIYATNPLAIYRDGAEALRMAKELYSLDKEVQYVEVIAAAYAELDEFDKAIEILEEGIRLTSDLVQKEDFRFDIKNYKTNKKIRMW
ncbi:MAG: hypothetical protein C0602_12835 [Denitrovibrio sp.]|nr:MAG: hypothetical protein C0602_12835 [Denitrovibrio sp.]